MNEVYVLIGSALFVSFVVWWFFGKHEKTSAKATVIENAQDVVVTVDGGYAPNTVILQKGVPATITFNRKDASNCFSHVVFPDFGVNEELPVSELHSIEIDTSKAGEYTYACGMNMFHGKVVISE